MRCHECLQNSKAKLPIGRGRLAEQLALERQTCLRGAHGASCTRAAKPQRGVCRLGFVGTFPETESRSFQTRQQLAHQRMPPHLLTDSDTGEQRYMCLLNSRLTDPEDSSL